MLKAYKYRLYPNDYQKIMIGKTFDCVRFTYNKMLSERKEIYELYRDNKEELKKQKSPTPAKYKTEFVWLKEVDSLVLSNTQMNLDKAYKSFFRRIKNGEKDLGFPKFKSKRNPVKSYTTNNLNNNIAVEGYKIKLPKIGYVKCKLHREFESYVLHVIIKIKR